ncbi:GNAT family N-acetyltransferase [Shewanella sp. AS16]|uniref:GNAT family N-acetyltransferase n=1 Tax=Shewanella sp. AS16 TaxID=2907625 RepID=UPI001F260D5E|nr:GNAT family N-acetyltransferase [Shewanella sp. AS16]MCE9686625.1 GNAT family N-acetyltransferase [Shewanella sp. AS16]
MRVRLFERADVAQLAEVFHLSISLAAATHYSQAQRHAWSGAVRSEAYWLARLQDTQTWVAEEAGVILGFINLKPPAVDAPGSGRPSAEIDCLFTHPEHQRRGLAGLLYQALLQHARASGMGHLCVEASHLAMPFFLKQGFVIHSHNQHPRGGEILENFSMTLALG